MKEFYMKGNGNVISFKTSTELASTTYNTNFKGLKTKFTSRALFRDSSSTVTGGIIPDPNRMSSTFSKLD
jgi:hypothetical protein